MPSSVDFDYVGNAAGAMHYMVPRSNRHQLDYCLNLRRYKATSEFKADAPFAYPATKGFRPELTLQEYVDFAAGTGQNFKKKAFREKFDEKNCAKILFLIKEGATTGKYEQLAW